MEIRKKIIFNYLLIASILIMIVAYLFVLFKYAVNVPRYDDYELFLKYLIAFDNNTFLDSRICLTFAQHNEHRPIIERLVALIQASFFKRINFAHLIFIGNLMLVFSGFLLFKQYKKRIPALWLLFLIIAVIFNINSWENMLWATAALQNYSGLFFCLLAFHYAVNVKDKFWFYSFLFSVFALMTGGLGLFPFPILIIYFAIVRKKYWIGLTLLALSILPFYLYFLHYTPNIGHADTRFWITHYPYDVFNYFIIFLGNFTIGLGISNIYITQLMGYILFLFSIYSVIRYKRMHAFSLMVISLVVLSAMAAAAGRVNFGYIQAMSSRYQILSLLLVLVFVVEILFPYLRRRNASILLAPLFVIFCFCSYWHNFKYARNMCYDLKKSAFCHNTKVDANDYQHPAPFFHPQGLIREAALHRIYFMPNFKGSFECK